MATITYRTTENTAERLKSLAANRNISVNKLIDELAAYAIASHDIECRFRARAARGSAQRGIATLDELDAHYADYAGGGNHGTSSTLHDSGVQAFEHGGLPPVDKDKG